MLPIAFTLSSLDAFQRYRALNIQAGCRFADANFSRQVAAGKLQAKSLERFACIALAGVCAEFLKFGKAEGGMSDINQLDRLLKALQVPPSTSCAWLRFFLPTLPSYAVLVDARGLVHLPLAPTNCACLVLGTLRGHALSPF